MKEWILLVYIASGYAVFQTDEWQCQAIEARVEAGYLDQIMGPKGQPELIIRAECLGPPQELVEVEQGEKPTQ